MKKILLATTILVGSASFAAADVSFSGEGGFGVKSTTGGPWRVYHDLQLDIAFSGTTDGGLEFGAEWTIKQANAHNNRDVELFISGDFGKVTVGEKANVTYIGYEHSFGDFSFEATYRPIPATWNVELGYDFGDYDVYLKHASSGVTGIGGNAEFGDFTLGLEIKNVSLASTTWEATAGWSSGAISVDATVGAGNAWKLEAGYDLGGGAVVEASFDNLRTYSLGVAMEF